MQSKASSPAPLQRRGGKRILIGITGGIGSGKSLASEFIESSGYKVIYADDVAKKLYRTNKALKAKLVDAFGKGILDERGHIAGYGARKIILSNKRNLKRVNKIVHPFVRKEIDILLRRIRDNVVFIEAAIMFDSGYYKKMDLIVLIYTPKRIRIKRASKRDKIPAAEVKRLMDLQMDERKKIMMADIVIRNDGRKEKLYRGLNALLEFVKQ